MDQETKTKLNQTEKESPVSILVVDDEPDARVLLKRVFAEDYRVLTAANAFEAKKIIEDETPDIVISDQRMPGMTGVDLLAWVYENHNDVVRVLTTAHDDLDAAIRSINLGHVQHYVTKPWDIDALKNIVDMEISHRRLQVANVRLQKEIAQSNLELTRLNRRLQEANDELAREATRADSLRRYADSILDTLSVSLIIVDSDLCVQSINKCPIQTDVELKSFIGRPLRNLPFSEKAANLFVDAAARVIREKTPTSLGELVISEEVQGELLWQVELYPLQDMDGKTQALIQIQDISRAYRLHIALIQAERMAGVGSLAAGVAHEFNNLIGGIWGYAQLAQATEDNDDYKKMVDIVFEVSARAKKIIGDLLGFAHRSDEMVEVAKVGELVGQIVNLLEKRLKKQNIELVLDIPDYLCIKTNVGNLQQAIFQLLMIAEQCMTEGGQIKIKSYLDDENQVRVVISDSGLDLDRDSLDEFTSPSGPVADIDSMDADQKIGYGLAVARHLIEQLKAKIDLKIGKQGGCLAVITMPPETTHINDISGENHENQC